MFGLFVPFMQFSFGNIARSCDTSKNIICFCLILNSMKNEFFFCNVNVNGMYSTEAYVRILKKGRFVRHLQ